MQNLKIATEQDYDTILNYAQLFFKESGYDYIQWNEAKAFQTIKTTLSLPKTEAICLLSTHGIIAAQVAPLPFSYDRISTEILWWISPEHRGQREALQLLDAYEYWSKEVAKCTAAQMVCLETLAPEKVDKLYKRKGFNKVESVYLKVFNDGTV
jgi:hypothetical protein